MTAVIKQAVDVDPSGLSDGDLLQWNAGDAKFKRLAATVLSGNVTGSGNLTGNLTVQGTSTLTGDATTGNITATGLVAVTGNVTVSGNMTCSGNLVRSAGNVTAAGTVQGNATAVTENVTWALGANGTKGVVLPTAVAGLTIALKNDDTANAILKVYPQGNATINALSPAGAISMAAKTSAVFACYTSGDSGAWFTIPLLPS